MDQETFKSYLLSFLHIPYKWGGASPMEGFDCSGFVQEVLYGLGIITAGDSTADDLYRHFSINGMVSKTELGTLLFFGSGQHIVHVSFALNDMTMIEAGGGGSQVVTLAQAIERHAFIRLRPIACRKDLVARINPKYPWRAKKQEKPDEYH